MKSTVETKEVTITTRVFTLEVTEDELRALEMGVERLSSSYVTRKNPPLATTVKSVGNELRSLLNMDTDEEELYDEAEEDDD